MNFKKYHVSRNLFDGTLLNGYFKNNTFELGGSGTIYKSIKVYLTAGTYTISTSNQIRVIRTIFDDVWSTQNIPDASPYNFSIATDGYIGISIQATQNDTPWDSSTTIMLNEGSTALPYEPYSSEVWHDTPNYIHKTATDTLTSIPAVVYPNASTATVGLKGQTVQSSTPTPAPPVMPEGCGDMTGNLAYKIIENTNISAEGLIASASGYNVMVAKVAQGQAYSGTGYVYAFFNNEPDIGSVSYNESRVVNNFRNVTAPISGYVAVRYAPSENPMLNLGSTPLPYEPYGYKLTISSANTTTPVYLGEMETTRKIRKMVFDGTENWRQSSDGNIYISLSPNQGIAWVRVLSTHFTPSQVQTNGGLLWFVTASVDFDTAEECKSYLAAQYAAGTPVTIWYVLANEETAVVNEPLMKIGNYADEVSNISIPVTAGGDTISIDTTVQPSEVIVNYKGWHPVQSVHEKSRNLMVFNTDSPIGSVNFNATPEKDTAQFVINKVQGSSAQSCTIPLSIPLKKGTYTLSVIGIINRDGSYDRIYIRDEGGVIVNYVQEGSPKTFTLANDTTITALSIPCGATSTYDNITVKVMLNEGSTALPYEPYWN